MNTVGVIQRQSLKFTAVNFIGTFIGFLSVVFVYSLDKELYGYFQTVHSFATLLVTLLGFGIQGAIIKYHPYFVQKERAAHFLSFTLVVALISSILSTFFLYLLYSFGKSFLQKAFPNFVLVEENTGSILLLSFLLLFSSIFIHHAATRYRIVVPDMIMNVGLKIVLPVFILLVYFHKVPEFWFIPGILMYFGFITVILFLYLLSLDTFSLHPMLHVLNRTEYRGLGSFMIFTLLNNLGGAFALKIDLAMIGMMLSKEAVGVYAIIMTISNVMEIPLKAISQIAGPVVSSNWANQDRANIQDVYQKSSVYGMLGGVYLFTLLFFIWPDIMAFMPGKLASYNEVILIFVFLGGARLIDLSTGINSIILAYSDYYKVHMYFLIVLGIVNACLNYLLLGMYGLPGAAAATFISYLVFNGLKYIFVSYKFHFRLRFQTHAAVFVGGVVVFGIMYVTPFMLSPLGNMVAKGIIVSTLTFGIFWWLNPGDVRTILRQAAGSLRFFNQKK
jgi:O-antigen/teichoic acid export membrane protein